MLALHDLQDQFAQALMGDPSAELLAEIEPDGLSAEARLQIYANHVRVSLVEALAANYPVIWRLIGEACFNQVARRFALDFPPTTPCMAEYGRAFPGFLSNEPVLRTYAYLAGVARLERALVEVSQAVDPPAAALQPTLSTDLGETEHLRLALAPSVRLVVSCWPVDVIWRANQPDVPDQSLVITAVDTCLMILRDRDGDVAWLRLSRGQQALLQALEAGRGLAGASTLARGIEPGLEPLPFLKALSEAGLLLDAALATRNQRRFT